ncbi:hypothetical protein [Halobaculum roseum]|uniref:Uncharacterized protein n=1 Tax=Halobaculum roseum TaxID=2175149 RepID=A0ABD5MPZ3_9EURY|nr:hypothetical protein [Halobaculum roseum]QZY01320.1 hypothetical protein K6T36_08120 [Halobaculum roseum]
MHTGRPSTPKRTVSRSLSALAAAVAVGSALAFPSARAVVDPFAALLAVGAVAAAVVGAGAAWTDRGWLLWRAAAAASAVAAVAAATVGFAFAPAAACLASAALVGGCGDRTGDAGRAGPSGSNPVARERDRG